MTHVGPWETKKIAGHGRYYSVIRVEGDAMAWLRQYFEDGADQLNWLFLSTSGVHGSYATLDTEGLDHVTFLVVSPRIVCTYYGNVESPTEADIEWLRATVRQTMDAVAKSQEGNT